MTVTIKRGDKIGHKGHGKYIYSPCLDCGKERWVLVSLIKLKGGEPISKRCRSCSNKQKGLTQHGNKSSRWKGGRILTPAGYIYVWTVSDDFFYPMANSIGYIMEHRLIMAKHLGRNLHRWEIVHHKNGIKNDNRIENLQLVSELGHKQITILEGRIARLEDKVSEQGKLIKLLQWQIKQEVTNDVRDTSL